MRVNPKFLYPEFASEIVRLGLAAFERQAEWPYRRGTVATPQCHNR